MSINDEMARQTSEQNIDLLVDRLREERNEALSLLQATQAELFDRTVAHEVSHSMARAYLAMMSDTLIELTRPDVDKDAEPPELPQIAKKVRAQLDTARMVLSGIVNDCDVDGNWGCVYCGNQASCFGGYAGCHDEFRFACDDCCGHGNEDGWCIPVAKLREALGNEG